MTDALLVTAQLGFVAVGAWLTHIDISEHRLPNRIVAPTAAALVVLCALAAAVAGSVAPLVSGALGALLLGGFYIVLRAVSRGSLGAGDVKLAVPTGLILGWDGGLALVVGAVLAFVVGGLWAVGVIVTGRGTRSTHIAFGPCIILGAVLGLAVT